MKLSVKAFAITSALLWAGLLLMVGAANLAWPGYGMAFLDGMGSVYPGFHPGTGASSVVVGSLYGLLDAGIGGAIFAWLYNVIAGADAFG